MNASFPGYDEPHIRSVSISSDSIDFEKVMNCYEIVFKKLVEKGGKYHIHA